MYGAPMANILFNGIAVYDTSVGIHISDENLINCIQTDFMALQI